MYSSLFFSKNKPQFDISHSQILTFISVWCMRAFKAGNKSLIVFIGGGGSLFLHKFTMTHVTFLKNEIGISGLMNDNRGFTTPNSITKSLKNGPSPIIFPNAHTACSHTFWCGECNNFKNSGIAPADTTLFVCSEVPDAILVSAQAASNCNDGFVSSSKQFTSIGRMPLLIRGSMGGLRSADKSLRAVCTAASWTCVKNQTAMLIKCATIHGLLKRV